MTFAAKIFQQKNRSTGSRRANLANCREIKGVNRVLETEEMVWPDIDQIAGGNALRVGWQWAISRSVSPWEARH